MPERVKQAPINIWEARDMKVKDPYLAIFESRLARIEPVDYGRRRAMQLDSNLTVINPDRLMPAVLVITDEAAEILLGDGRELQRDIFVHHEICRQNDVRWGVFNTFSAILMTIGEKRFLSLPILSHLSEPNIEKLRSLFQRYRIEGVFAPTHEFDHNEVLGTRIRNTASDWNITWVSLSDYVKTMDELVRDDWTSQIAETYGLTNTELLRLRLTGELPEDKRKPIRKTPLGEE